MANSTRFLIEIPDVGASADTWGNILNAYFNSLEPLVFDKRGDTVNGNLSVTGSTSVTTLAASGALTLTGGTANGVAYLNGSKQLVSGSALTFDGTRLTATAGKFGTGVAANSATLMVNNPSGTATQIQLFQDGVESWTMGMPASSAGLAWAVSGSEQMRLTSTGLGIGTSAPVFKLDVTGVIRSKITDGGDSTGVVLTANGSTNSRIEFQTSDGSGRYRINANGDNNLSIATNSQGVFSDALVIDRVTRNLGLGVTPSAWSVGKALQVGSTTAVFNDGSGATYIGNNFNFNSGFKYLTNNVATSYVQGNGHIWFTAPSGTAGNPITFTQAMTLTQGGNLLLGTTTDSGKKIDARGDGTQTIRAVSANGQIAEFDATSLGNFSWKFQGTSDSMRFVQDATERARITSAGNTRPGADNAYTLGEPTFRWSVVYAATGTINTSDVRAKLDFAPTFGLNFINALEPVSYRYKNGKTVIDQIEDGVEEVSAVLDEDGNEVTPATTKPKFKSVERVVEGQRRHHGLKAQQVKSVLDTLGVDFAGWVMDDHNDPDSPQGLRYDQFIAPLIKAVQELSARVAELESRA